uniref:Reverse transcriptase domain-containing protein n=1 Tax=Amphimedon queenslandica TaxID=400682 RepID=A0A1X7T2U4_AMPQE
MLPCNIRGHGGIAILWHKSFDKYITVVKHPVSEQMLGILIDTGLLHLLIVSEYLSTRSGCTADFVECLDILDSCFSVYPGVHLLFGEDFNANPGPAGGPFSITSANEQGHILKRYLDRSALALELSHLALSPLTSPEEIESYSVQLTSSLLSSAQRHVKSVTRSSHLKPKWLQSLSTLHKACKIKYRVWLASGHSFNQADPHKIDYKAAEAAFRRAHRAYQRKSLTAFYDSLDPSSKDVFRTIRSHFGKLSLSTTHLILEGQKYSGSDIICGWEQYFANLSSGTDSIPDTSSIDHLVLMFQFTPHNPSDTPSFSPEEIRESILHLPKGKAMPISSEHLLHSANICAPDICNLFNSILTVGAVPSSFCKSLIIPLYKGQGKLASDPSNYRGISLTSILSKLFEKVLYPHLADTPTPLLHPLQGGFRSGFSSLHTSLVLQEGIEECKANHSKALLAFLDARKAFDTVWHSRLFFKLLQSGIAPSIWKVLYFWYSHLESAVMWDNLTSQYFPVTQGV